MGYCRMMSVYKAMDWSILSLDSLCEHGFGYLPSHRLNGPDTIDFLKQHKPEEYTTIDAMFKLHNLNESQINYLSGFFGRVAGWNFTQKSLLEILHNLVHGTFVSKSLALSRVFA